MSLPLKGRKRQTPEARVLATLEASPYLREIVKAEPDIRHVLHVAAMQQEARSRWVAYTALKQICEPLVGWDARNTHLQTEWHYQTVIKAIDELLIRAEEEGEEQSAQEEE